MITPDRWNRLKAGDVLVLTSRAFRVLAVHRPLQGLPTNGLIVSHLDPDGAFVGYSGLCKCVLAVFTPKRSAP